MVKAGDSAEKSRSKRVLIGCVVFPIGLIFTLALFVGVRYFENQKVNEAAKKLWLSLCKPSQLYESGTFDNWDKIYSDIEKGSFPDSVHLMQPVKSGMPEDLWKVKGSDRVFLSKYNVSFMESDSKMTIRDPQFRELDFWPGLLGLGYRQYSCIYKNHPYLDKLLWQKIQ